MRGNDAKRANQWELDGQTDRVNAGVIVTRDTNHAEATKPPSLFATWSRRDKSANNVWGGGTVSVLGLRKQQIVRPKRKPGRV